MFKVKKKVLRDNDIYKIWIEEVHSNLFIHVNMKGAITTKLIRDLKKDWEEYKIKIKRAGYPALYTYSAEPRFYQFFKGYEDLGSMDWDEGQYRVLKWELTQ